MADYIVSYTFVKIYSMKSFLICLFLLGGFSTLNAQSYQPFKENGKYGFKKNGAVVIAAQYEYASHFVNRLALVQSSGKWGYIDSLGSWIIPPKFDRAQPFQVNNALVEIGNKVGMIDTLGNFLLEPKYSNIVEDYSGYNVYEGDLRGYIEKEKMTVIPAVYTKIEFYYGINVGKLPNGKYDIYMNGKLVIGNLNEAVNYNDINYYFKTIRIKENGKYGLYHFSRGWITARNYGSIEEIYVPGYKLEGSDNTYNRIFALHTLDPSTVDIEVEVPEDSITFIRVDGSKISPLVFNRFQSYYTEYMDGVPFDIIKAWSNGKIYTMDQQLNVSQTRYNSIEPHLEWYIAEDGEKYYILNKYKFPIDSFQYIHPHYQFTSYYDENTGDILGDDQMVIEPYVIFQKGDVEMPLQAIYDLNLRKIVSPWLPGKLNITLHHTEFGIRAYTYGDFEKIGFYVQGMPIGTEMKYAPDAEFSFFYSNNSDFYFHFLNSDSGRDELYHSSIHKVTKLGEFDKIHNSMAMAIDTFYQANDDIGEPYFARIQLFNKGFFVLRDKGKMGLLTWNGKIIAPAYDSLVDNENTYIIHTYEKGLYGSVNLMNGDEIKPFMPSPFVFSSDNYDEEHPDYYLRFESERDSYYLNSDDTKFYCHFSDVNVKKVGRKYGLVGYSDLLNFDQNEITVVPPIHKEIVYTETPHAYKVRNKEKKWGVLDFKGDTLIPFIYDKMTSAGMEVSNGETYLKTQIKKKVGLVGLRNNIVIPAIYDEITQFMYDYEMYMAFLVKRDKKYGVFSLSGKEILPCEFNEIRAEYIGGDNSEIRFIGVTPEAITPRRFSNYNEIYYIYPLKAYNFISNNKAYRTNGAYLEQFDLETGLIEQMQDLSNASVEGTEYNISLRNGKFGACDREGKELIAAEYDFAEFMEGRDEVMIGYQKGVKYYIYVFTKERYTEQQW